MAELRTISLDEIDGEFVLRLSWDNGKHHRIPMASLSSEHIMYLFQDASLLVGEEIHKGAI